MYADGGLLFPFLQGLDFYREAQPQCYHPQLQEDELLWRLQNSIIINSSGSTSTTTSSSSSYWYQEGSHLPSVSTPSGIQTSWISEYDLGGEGDLFKAPEPILEEAPQLTFDPMATAISMISGGEDITSGEVVARAAAVEMDTMVSSDPLLSEVFYECRKDLLAKSAIEEPVAVQQALDIEIPELDLELELELQPQPQPQIDAEEESRRRDRAAGAEGALQKSVSSGCLLSNERSHVGMPPRPSFLGFQDVDLGAAFGMRRAYSEGDIKRLESSSSIGHVNTRDIFRSEERQQKLSRYRKKKEKRNFGHKIKYACRKALADSQPRVRGRFARTEECEVARH